MDTPIALQSQKLTSCSLLSTSNAAGSRNQIKEGKIAHGHRKMWRIKRTTIIEMAPMGNGIINYKNGNAKHNGELQMHKIKYLPPCRPA
jgi:hypothetical protein